MRIGLICEGHTDRAVISNVLKGLKGIDPSDIVPLRPENSLDETDLAELDPNLFSSWTVVKEECLAKTKLRRFLSIEGQEAVIIHIDSAESDDYGVSKPRKDSDYSKNLRSEIITKIKEWLDGEFEEKEILYAVAVEETEAWILTLFESKDSTKSADPKTRLKRVLSKKGKKYNQNYNDFLDISDAFSKNRNYRKMDFLKYNESLKAFCIEVNAKL